LTAIQIGVVEQLPASFGAYRAVAMKFAAVGLVDWWVTAGAVGDEAVPKAHRAYALDVRVDWAVDTSG
jgi:hypothetical protein